MSNEEPNLGKRKQQTVEKKGASKEEQRPRSCFGFWYEDSKRNVTKMEAYCYAINTLLLQIFELGHFFNIKYFDKNHNGINQKVTLWDALSSSYDLLFQYYNNYK